jgi:hypothetical protein
MELQRRDLSASRTQDFNNLALLRLVTKGSCASKAKVATPANNCSDLRLRSYESRLASAEKTQLY